VPARFEARTTARELGTAAGTRTYIDKPRKQEWPKPMAVRPFRASILPARCGMGWGIWRRLRVSRGPSIEDFVRHEEAVVGGREGGAFDVVDDMGD